MIYCKLGFDELSEVSGGWGVTPWSVAHGKQEKLLIRLLNIGVRIMQAIRIVHFTNSL